MDCGKTPSGVRKMKKKQVKDELDRIKQAEKKKRRLEKALATSAAIISELEKKKQNKIEEQKRLDEEGAAIAEAVALQVLTGEDSDDLFAGGSGGGGGGGARTAVVVNRQFYGNRNEEFGWEFGWIVNAHGGSRCQWYENGCGNLLVDEISERAVSALQIADDDDINGFVFNQMVR